MEQRHRQPRLLEEEPPRRPLGEVSMGVGWRVIKERSGIVAWSRVAYPGRRGSPGDHPLFLS